MQLPWRGSNPPPWAQQHNATATKLLRQVLQQWAVISTPISDLESTVLGPVSYWKKWLLLASKNTFYCQNGQFAEKVGETKSLLSERKRESEVMKNLHVLRKVLFFSCVKHEKLQYQKCTSIIMLTATKILTDVYHILVLTVCACVQKLILFNILCSATDPTVCWKVAWFPLRLHTLACLLIA